MKPVAFISTETGDDLIVSFGVYDPDEPAEIVSLTVLRTPKYEGLLPEEERGATVTFEEENPEDNAYLLAVGYSPSERCVSLRANAGDYTLDVRKVDPGELSAMRRVFQKMNFDDRIQLSGI